MRKHAVATRVGGLFVLFMVSNMLVSCAGLSAKGTPTDASPIPPNIQYQVVQSAKIERISVFEALYEGVNRLHFEVTLKNVSQDKKRFRLNIFLPEGPSAGGLYPEKGMLDPQKSLTLKFPMYFNQLPSGFTLVVKELQP